MGLTLLRGALGGGGMGSIELVNYQHPQYGHMSARVFSMASASMSCLGSDVSVYIYISMYTVAANKIHHGSYYTREGAGGAQSS